MPDRSERSDLGRFELRTKVWIERDGGVVISDYLAELLETVAEHGSVAAAAGALDLPLRTAWKKLRQMEAAAGVPLVGSASGGAEGGTTQLSPAAEKMIAAFRRISAPVSELAGERLELERAAFPADESPRSQAAGRLVALGELDGPAEAGRVPEPGLIGSERSHTTTT